MSSGMKTPIDRTHTQLVASITHVCEADGQTNTTRPSKRAPGRGHR